MKIYTGNGDRGMTSLFSGERVKKSCERVEAYGDVDELYYASLFRARAKLYVACLSTKETQLCNLKK